MAHIHVIKLLPLMSHKENPFYGTSIVFLKLFFLSFWKSNNDILNLAFPYKINLQVLTNYTLFRRLNWAARQRREWQHNLRKGREWPMILNLNLKKLNTIFKFGEISMLDNKGWFGIHLFFFKLNFFFSKILIIMCIFLKLNSWNS